MDRERVSDYHIDDLLRIAASRRASDLHLTVGLPPQLRVDGRLAATNFEPVQPEDTQRMIYDILSDRQITDFERTHELDMSYGISGVGRFRVNIFMQRGCIAGAFRMIPTQIPSFQELNLPPVLRDLSTHSSGLILVTGPTGCGKSTTQATMINYINHTRQCHIVTIEDPIEYLHHHKKCMINQRELGSDTYGFTPALRSVLREDPDVILVGEMRDLETIDAALTLAETGHLVFGTLHTRSAAQSIDRVVDVFPPHQQEQIRVLLANTVDAIVAQQLLPRQTGIGRVPAVEIMIANAAVRNLIRDNKSYQIPSLIETGVQQGMQTMDRALADLVRRGIVSFEEALARTIDTDNFNRLLKTV